MAMLTGAAGQTFSSVKTMKQAWIDCWKAGTGKTKTLQLMSEVLPTQACQPCADDDGYYGDRGIAMPGTLKQNS